MTDSDICICKMQLVLVPVLVPVLAVAGPPSGWLGSANVMATTTPCHLAPRPRTAIVLVIMVDCPSLVCAGRLTMYSRRRNALGACICPWQAIPETCVSCHVLLFHGYYSSSVRVSKTARRHCIIPRWSPNHHRPRTLFPISPNRCCRDQLLVVSIGVTQHPNLHRRSPPPLNYPGPHHPSLYAFLRGWDLARMHVVYLAPVVPCPMPSPRPLPPKLAGPGTHTRLRPRARLH